MVKYGTKWNDSSRKKQVDRKTAQNLLKLCKVIYHSTWGSDSVLLGVLGVEGNLCRQACCCLCQLHAVCAACTYTHTHTHCKFWCRGEISVCLAYQNNTLWSKVSEVINTHIHKINGSESRQIINTFFVSVSVSQWFHLASSHKRQRSEAFRSVRPETMCHYFSAISHLPMLQLPLKTRKQLMI